MELSIPSQVVASSALLKPNLILAASKGTKYSRHAFVGTDLECVRLAHRHQGSGDSFQEVHQW